MEKTISNYICCHKSKFLFKQTRFTKANGWTNRRTGELFWLRESWLILNPSLARDCVQCNGWLLRSDWKLRGVQIVISIYKGSSYIYYNCDLEISAAPNSEVSRTSLFTAGWFLHQNRLNRQVKVKPVPIFIHGLSRQIVRRFFGWCLESCHLWVTNGRWQSFNSATVRFTVIRQPLAIGGTSHHIVHRRSS
jgi:hypothetical protein